MVAPNTAWIVPVLIPLVLGVLVGFIIRRTVKLSISIIALAVIPLIIKSGKSLGKNFDDVQGLVPAMASTITFSRVTGALFVIGFLITL